MYTATMPRVKRPPYPRAHSTRCAAIALSFFLCASWAAAQDAPLVPGARVRVTLRTPPQSLVARFDALTDTTLALAGNSSPRVIPLSNVERIEWSRGRKPGVLGGVVGFLVGGALGGVAGCAANRDSYGVFCGGQSDTKVAVGTALGGIAGAALGAYLGRRDRWTPLALPRRSRDIDPLTTLEALSGSTALTLRADWRQKLNRERYHPSP